MKKYFIHFFIVIVALVVIDLLIGCMFNQWKKHLGLKGDYEKIEYLMKQFDSDILIMGSSTAINSTKPSVLSRELGLTVFNGACSAQQLPFFDYIIDETIKHYKPRYILLALTHLSLITDDYGRISIMNTYYNSGNKMLDTIIEHSSEHPSLLLKSNLYRLNTIGFRILCSQFFLDNNSMRKDGYSPHPVGGKNPILVEDKYNGQLIPHSMPLSHLEQIVKMCQEHGIKLIIYIAPMYRKAVGGPNAGIELLMNFCATNGVTLLDYSELFLDHPDYFYDNIHLNDNGANVFSERFSLDLKQVLN